MAAVKAGAAGAVMVAAAVKAVEEEKEAVMEFVQSKQLHPVFRNRLQRLREADTEVSVDWYTRDADS
jgi:ribonuclease HII|tara:strand:+ start:204 stop:404 length:201 start_codon:yes stop_codon:yes gene_type:complete